MPNSPRRGARRPGDVPLDVLTALEHGAQSANHMEQIAMDMGTLLTTQFPDIAPRADELRGVGLVVRMRNGGRLLLEEIGLEVAYTAATWPSDTTRGWAAMAVGAAPGLPLDRRLQLIQPFADDAHFAVREWAWLSLRPCIAENVPEAIEVLAGWTCETSPRLRRFASEVTRPRGVWSIHLPLLKRRPQLGMPILDPLRADPSRYVQDSVSNWLNDAAKSQPDWVLGVCRGWQAVHPLVETTRICRRGCRSIPADYRPSPRIFDC